MRAVKFPRDEAANILKAMEEGSSWALIRSQETSDPANAVRNRSLSNLVRPLPSLDQLEELLDIAYVASTLEEEGRRVDFTLAYLSEEGARELKHRTFPFTTPLPFVPSRLAKYALAAVPLTSSFGVWTGADGKLEIWGLTHHGNHVFDVDFAFLPTYLSIRVLRAATFTVHFDERLLLLFSRDHIRIFQEEAGKRIGLVEILRDRLCIDADVAVALRRVCERMVALRHGGTLLLTQKGGEKIGVKMHDTLTPRGQGFALLKDVVDAGRRPVVEAREKAVREGTIVHQRYAHEEKHREALDFVAQLTAVDGAVLLDDDLSVYGFGATIATDTKVPPVTSEHPGELGSKKPYDLERRGNRHRSAVAFCAQQKGPVVAFVASQDGDFSIMTRELDGSVNVIGPFELGVGL